MEAMLVSSSKIWSPWCLCKLEKLAPKPVKPYIMLCSYTPRHNLLSRIMETHRTAVIHECCVHMDYIVPPTTLIPFIWGVNRTWMEHRCTQRGQRKGKEAERHNHWYCVTAGIFSCCTDTQIAFQTFWILDLPDLQCKWILQITSWMKMWPVARTVTKQNIPVS